MDKQNGNGIAILAYAMELLRQKRIKPRHLYLLAAADRFCNPKNGNLMEHAAYTPEQLKREMGLSATANADERRAIQHLVDIDVMSAERVGRYWHLVTTSEDKRDTDFLYLRPSIAVDFRNGKLTPIEALVMGRIAGFTVDGKDCHMTSLGFADDLGISRGTARNVLMRLRRKGYLMQDDGRKGVKRCLYPTDASLYGKGKQKSKPKPKPKPVKALDPDHCYRRRSRYCHNQSDIPLYTLQ